MSGRFAGDLEAGTLDHDVIGIGAGWEARRDFVRKRIRDGLPSDLPSVARAACPREGFLARALQQNVLALHAQQRSAADSVLREKTVSWLTSEAGQEWQKERQLLFSGGLPPAGSLSPAEQKSDTAPCARSSKAHKSC